MISQIERQRTNPSLKILERLGEALQVPLATLLDGSAEPAAHHDLPLVRRKAERPEFPVGNNGMMKELLSPTGAHDLQLMVITLPPGVGSEDVLIGEGEKAGLVLEGVLTVEVGAKKIELAKGDSVQFNSSLTHRVNNHGDENAKFIWVISTSPPIAHI
jgi:quercetin dioxygenase-like cupin family protein